MREVAQGYDKDGFEKFLELSIPILVDEVGEGSCLHESLYVCISGCVSDCGLCVPLCLSVRL